MNRIFIQNEAYYHCYSMTVHERGLLDAEARSVLVKILHKVAGFCGVTVVTYSVMESHFHLLLKVPPQAAREGLADEELVRRFRLLYGDGRTHFMPITAVGLEMVLAADGADAVMWRNALKARMHDLPMLMKLLKQRFSKWYNATRKVKGTLWADRYGSTLIDPDPRVLAQVACCIDLHAVRAGVVEHPEDYAWCGFAAARLGDRTQAEALAQVMVREGKVPRRALLRYEALLYRSGGMQPKRTRRDVLAEFLLGGLGPTGNPVMDHFIPDTVNQLAILGGAIVFGGYVFVEAQAQWVAKLLGRKKPGSCHQLGEGEWTLNQRLKKGKVD
jgi:REP element-mobilizing transposase RayT